MKKLKTYNIIVIGCQMNIADGERIAGYLELQGLKGVEDRKKADLIILVTCGVRQSAENRIFGLIPTIKKENPKAKILLTGCLAYRNDIKSKIGHYVDFWIPINLISNFQFRISNKSFRNNISNFKNSDLIQNSKFKIQNYLNILPKYSSNFSAFVPIGNGCNNFCAYCVVPYARGREVYRPANEIVDEVRDLVKKGYKEITLIAQNVNSYLSPKSILGQKSKVKSRKSINCSLVNFPTLLSLINDIPGKFWIRFATSHPKDMSDELIKTISECEKVCEHIHLPVQAGDDEILRKMNRNYTIKHYKQLIKKIRKINQLKIKNYKLKIDSKFKIQNSKLWILPVSVSTDVIVGFPGETRKQFLNTVKLFKEMEYDLAYIACYSPRPGTAAAKLKDNVSREEKIRREKELNKILGETALKNNKKFLNKDVEVLINSQNKKGELFGFTRTYKNVKIAKSKKKLKVGQFVNVHITNAKNFGLEGETL